MAVLWAFPYGSGYPLYLFCLYRTKKDAAAIPNAAFKIPQHPTNNKSISCTYQIPIFCKIELSRNTTTALRDSISFPRELVKIKQ